MSKKQRKKREFAARKQLNCDLSKYYWDGCNNFPRYIFSQTDLSECPQSIEDIF